MQDIVEVLAMRVLTIWVFVSKVGLDFRVILYLLPDLADAQFLVLRHGDHIDVLHLEQALLPR